MTTKLCRWGILSTANIARKNWKAIRKSGNATITAVGGRDRGRVEQYIRECNGDVSFDPAPAACNYEELLARSDVDAVYIPLPTGIRKEWVVRAAKAGKHVLCEKPCGANAAEVREMLLACAKHGVQFMDGVMFMHSRRLPLLRQILDDTSVGEIRRITSEFTFAAPPEFLQGNIRVHSTLEPLGALGDLGWYNIRFALWVMKYQMPSFVTGRILAQHGRSDSAEPVPTDFSGELFFADGVSAGFYCSFLSEIQQWANIAGTRGQIRLADFVLPFFGAEAAFELHQNRFAKEGCDFRMESHIRRYAVTECSSGAIDAQETNMIRTFSDIVLSNRLDPMWGEIAMKTQQVMDACFASAQADGKAVYLEKH